MKINCLKIATLLLLFFVQFGFSQLQISGTVTDNSGNPLPGVTIVVQGESIGTQTDFDGNYLISANEGQTLEFSYLGMATVTKTVGSQTVIDATMTEDTQALGEVVVTALGIKEDKRALGYAISSLDSKEIEQKTQADVARVISGKMSGVSVNQNSGLSGSGTNIIIRGYTSINQSNQPLFVVDGVPFNSATNTSQNFEDGVTESSRFLDLDPNSIQDVTVLKGLSAATLYGSQGRNGVILITTKNSGLNVGSKKTEVSITQSYFKNQASSIPNYQTTYGGGWNQFPAFYFSNWGARFDEAPEFQHPYGAFRVASLKEAFQDEYGPQKYDYRNYDNVDQFFRLGNIMSTSISVNGGSKNTAFNATYGRNYDEGFTPGNDVIKNNFGLGGQAILSNNITVSGTFNFAQTEYNTPPVSVSTGSSAIGANASIFANVLYTPRSIDLMNLPFESPINNQSVYYRPGNDIQNPRWTAKYAKIGQKVDRFFGNITTKWDLSDWINISYRLGLDTYTEFNSYGQNKGGADGDYANGIYRTLYIKNTIWDHTISINGKNDLSEDIGITYNVGFNPRLTEYSREGFESTNQVTFGILEHFNFINTSKVINNSDTDVSNDEQIGDYRFNSLAGVFGQAVLGYKNYLYLTFAGRYDITSTLENQNNKIFYPSMSLAYDVISGVSSLKGNGIIDYLKLRAGYGTSAGFPNPYATRNVLNLTSSSFVDSSGNSYPAVTTSNTLGNSDLKPELVSELEFGIESNWLDNRIGLNVSYFSKKTTDLIARRDLDPSTGYRNTFINGGEMKVDGVEIDFRARPIDINGLSWDFNGNFYANEPIVTSLPDGIERLSIAGYTNLGNFAVEGEPYGVMYATGYQRHSNGERLVGADGLYVATDEIVRIGDPNPDFTTALTNTFAYKNADIGNFSFSFEWQYQHGGDVYSNTTVSTIARGVSADTEFDRDQLWILPGVTSDGSKNTYALTSTSALFETYFNADEFRVWDGSTIRLNEISLSYNLPKKILEKTPFGNVSLTFSGFNLWQKAINFPKNSNFDTNVSATGVGNGRGFDFLSGLASRRFGGSLRLTF